MYYFSSICIYGEDKRNAIFVSKLDEELCRFIICTSTRWQFDDRACCGITNPDLEVMGMTFQLIIQYQL
jgi:hypothetical protein